MPAPDAPDRPFDAPWQAEAFALTVHLHERGVFDWGEWANVLSGVLAREQAAEEPSQSEYYRCWLVALGDMLAAKGIAPQDDLDRLTSAWQRAARATPHGVPICLENDLDPTRDGAAYSP